MTSSIRGVAHREELLNIFLAQILCDLGIVADPERLLGSLTRRTRMPDVLVEFAGLRIILEGKIGDTAAARRSALKQARERVQQGLSHISLAIVYPERLRTVEFDNLKERALRVSAYPAFSRLTPRVRTWYYEGRRYGA